MNGVYESTKEPSVEVSTSASRALVEPINQGNPSLAVGKRPDRCNSCNSPSAMLLLSLCMHVDFDGYAGSATNNTTVMTTQSCHGES